ncbi:MAG: hypothetical protein ACRD5B_14830 [Nitrososphaeraceae archaeon]
MDSDPPLLVLGCFSENLRSKDLKLRESAMRVLDEMIKEMEGYEKVMISY